MAPWMRVMLVAALLAAPVTAARIKAQDEPGDIVQPEIVIPGEWLTDKDERFLFLPLEVPKDIPLDQCKVMSNGEMILVVVTETPQEEPETKALQKYRLIIEAIKKEAGGDEKLLRSKLQEWMATEDDEEVSMHIQAALDSLTKVREAKSNTKKRTVSVNLGLLAIEAAKVLPSPLEEKEEHHLRRTSNKTKAIAPAASVKQQEAHETKEEKEAEHSLASLRRAKKSQNGAQADLHVGVIKESFTIEIPYPVGVDHVFMLRASPSKLVIAMPLERKSLEAKGISTGGKPFERVPVFGTKGEQLAGPNAQLSHIAPALHVPSVANTDAMKPLED